MNQNAAVTPDAMAQQIDKLICLLIQAPVLDPEQIMRWRRAILGELVSCCYLKDI
jgi:hypothetical protein